MGTFKKSLDEYVSFGRHEFIAFVRDYFSANSSSSGTSGNKLGKINLGILFCDREFDSGKAKFYYKGKFKYSDDSDITYADFSYKNAQVVSEIPLGIDTPFKTHHSLEKGSQDYEEAKKLLQKYGLY